MFRERRTVQTARKHIGGTWVNANTLALPRKFLPRKRDFFYPERETLKNEYAAVLKYLNYMCNTYETFEELIEDEDNPKQLLENLQGINEFVYQDLLTTFDEMKSMIASPKCFLIQHFDDVRNQIDRECQNYLDNDELKVESKEKAILRQYKMIDEVDSFQKKCLANTKTEQTHQINFEEFEKRLQLQDKDDVMELGKELCCAIQNIKKELFMNQGIVFLTTENYRMLFYLNKDLNRQHFSRHDLANLFDSGMFGDLILIEDEFLINSYETDRWLYGYDDGQIEVDYCNEFLAMHLLERSILKHTNQLGQVVNRVQLNRTKLNDLDNRFFHSDEILVEKWSSDLPGLKKFNLDRLDKRMFQHLVNLEELKFWRMDLAKVDSYIFADSQSLRKLEISSKKLTLNSQSFNGLINLTELDLSSNQIAALPDGLFDSCTALKIVNLSYNNIIKLETPTFKNLVNLEELNLTSNSIKEFDSNVFLCNKELIKLRLNYNEITQLNEDFFKGLYQLTHLDLAYNQIVSLPKAPLGNCLKVVNLSSNKFIKLEMSSFQVWVYLEKLNLLDNNIERADFSNIFAHNKNLRILNISDNPLTSLNNQSFNGLNLTELHLRNCQITYLTEELFNGLVNLTDLDLCGNRIMSLPDGMFQNLTNLKDLDLSSNQISELPNRLFHSLVSLENLDLDLNELTNLSKGLFDNLICLKFLNLRRNQISIIPDGIFKNLVSLEELGLQDNHIMSLPKEFFKDLVSLESLKLENNVIETEDGNFLYIDIKNVKPFPEHIHIDLSDNDDSDDQNSTDEMKNEQNDPEADAEQDTKKRDRDCQENVGETLGVHDEESIPKRSKN